MGRARIMLGEIEEGLNDLRRGYDMWRVASGKFLASQMAAEAAAHLVETRQMDAAREFMLLGESAQAEVDEQCVSAELLRIRGRIAAFDNDNRLAETSYRQAIAIAEQQGTRLFALRAATDLADLFKGTERASEAAAILKPVYDTFPEGWDYQDMQRAKAAMDSLCA